MSNPVDSSSSVKRLLVVDDHILFREGLISLFNSTNDFEVVDGAGSVHQAIEKTRLLCPDIILMDFSLPDGTGLDATKAILAAMPGCKIVFLTVHEADDKLFAAVRAGAKGFLPKRIAGTDLISSLRALDRDELAISRKMASHIIEEFSQIEPQETKSRELLAKLSPREKDVLDELQEGLSNHEIAERLFISENTVKKHIQNILAKLGAENRSEASAIARQASLRG